MEFKAKLIHRAKSPDDGPDKWQVRIGGRMDSFATEYSKGVGLRKGHRQMDRTIHYFNNFDQLTAPVDPTLAEVMQSLALDATTYLDEPDLTEFAREYGYTDDVAEAVRVYEACKETALWFARMGLDPRSSDYHEEGCDCEDCEAA